MKKEIYDTIIIGSGPAGITAGIYAVRREMKALVIGKEPGGQVVWASEVENYPGFKRINNIELITKWNDHAKGLGVEFRTEEIQKIEKVGILVPSNIEIGSKYSKNFKFIIGTLIFFITPSTFIHVQLLCSST